MRGRPKVGSVVVGSLVTGFVLAVVLVAFPFAGAQENIISGVVLLAFAVGWALLAVLSRWTDQPQMWASVPAGEALGDDDPDGPHRRRSRRTEIRGRLGHPGSHWRDRPDQRAAQGR